jgi:hypothetical protein
VLSKRFYKKLYASLIESYKKSSGEVKIVENMCNIINNEKYDEKHGKPSLTKNNL